MSLRMDGVNTMGLWQDFFNGLRGTAVKAQTTATLTTWDGFGWSAASSTNFSNDASGWINAAKTNVWAANCIKARASAIAQCDMKLYCLDALGERVEIEAHPVLDLLDTVNPYFNKRSFRKMIERQLAIHGRCVVQKVRGIAQVEELYILPCDRIEILSTPQQLIAGYRWLPTREIIPVENIIDFWYPSDNGSALAQSPTETALNAINRYNKADLSQEAIDTRGGQGGGIVTYDTTILPVDMTRMMAQWDSKRKNPENAGMDLHMPSGTDYKSGALTAQQMQREERMTRLAKEIMAAYNVPPAMAGDYSDASVLANADAQTKAFWDLFAIDELQLVAETFTNQLLTEYTDAEGMWFEHDLSGIPALHEQADLVAKRAIDLTTGNIITIEEGREMLGMDSEKPQTAVIAPAAKASAAPILGDMSPFERAMYSAIYAVFLEFGVDAARAVTEDLDLDWDKFGQEIRAAVTPILRENMQAEFDKTLGALKIQAGDGVGETASSVWARSYAGDLEKRLSETTRKLIKNTIAEYQETPGMTIGDVEKSLQSAMGARRAETIAITEITRSAAEGVNAYQTALADNGIKTIRIWRTNADDLVCPICGPMNGQPESEWGGKTIPAHTRCRCFISLKLIL